MKQSQDQTNNSNSDIQHLISLEAKVNMSFAPKKIKEDLLYKIERLKKTSGGGLYSKEYESLSKYVDWIIQMPWGVYTKDNLDIPDVKEKLDKNHYGLDDTKNRILEYLAVLKLNTERVEENLTGDMVTLRGSSANAPILCFLGIQGVGKTSLAKSIAKALGRQFYRIPLGGLSSVKILRGIPRVDSDSEPGQIIKSMIRTGSMNPLVLLDEVDKVSNTDGARADVMAALLEVLDPEQNSTFVDHFFDFPVDLSKVMFITTANNVNGISAALMDRLEIIRFSSYTDEDKMHIGKNYMLPKVRKATGLGEDQFDIAEEVWPMIVRPLGFDAGIRELERTITNVARQAAMRIVQGQAKNVVITAQNFREFIPDDFGVLG